MYNLIKEELNNEKTFTENGATAYRTSGTNLVDFNFAISSLRGANEEKIQNYFSKVFYDDRMTAVKFMFYVGDVRGGLGERHIFKSCFKWLIKNQVEIAQCVIGLIPEYTRWDNMIDMLGTDEVADATIIGIIRCQLALDITSMKNNEGISLLAKWMPSENTSSAKTRNKARLMMRALGLSARVYRRTLSTLRKYLDVVEVKASSNNWSEIDYETVPSQANLKYKNAFIKHDEDRRKMFLESLKSGEAKINAGTLQCHEIIRKYIGEYSWYGNSEIKSVDDTLEELWKNLPNYETGNAMVVRDGSGSMYSGYYNGNVRPIDVATGLAIYMAEHANGIWKDKFITFSNRPSIIDLKRGKNLREKIDICLNENDVANTNVEATMELILNTAIKNNLKQEEMPESIIIVSDMQFDMGCSRWNESLFDAIVRKYEENGYKMPRLVFWNVNERTATTIPMQKNELGLVLCGGFSTAVMKMFMSVELDPYKILLEQINSERYDLVQEKLEPMFE